MNNICNQTSPLMQKCQNKIDESRPAQLTSSKNLLCRKKVNIPIILCFTTNVAFWNNLMFRKQYFLKWFESNDRNVGLKGP